MGPSPTMRSDRYPTRPLGRRQNVYSGPTGDHSFTSYGHRSVPKRHRTSTTVPNAGTEPARRSERTGEATLRRESLPDRTLIRRRPPERSRGRCPTDRDRSTTTGHGNRLAEPNDGSRPDRGRSKHVSRGRTQSLGGLCPVLTVPSVAAR
ncbi:hypothetical protein C487_18081 [Natrinema pallidum DSM 3751]|uniref:Uncharacterized protein n=1 Tax=Natrinema pallidum DSM 3751 TaxID=1227495 RepID=L9YGZ2_9EURY|nr:hypothetical protein C487_18081 [Natrinema pallidum DSM 3751]